MTKYKWKFDARTGDGGWQHYEFTTDKLPKNDAERHRIMMAHVMGHPVDISIPDAKTSFALLRILNV